MSHFNMLTCVASSHVFSTLISNFKTFFFICIALDSCYALNPANKTWGSVFQSLVTSTNIQDQITFKQSPFKTSCFAVECVNRMCQNVSIEAEFQGDSTNLILWS